MTSVGSDVKSILGVGVASRGRGSKAQKSDDKSKLLSGHKRKRDMIKTVPRASLYPTAKIMFKKRPKSDIRWKWQPIVSSARPDDIQLFHWAKLNKKDYVYAQYNKEIEMLEYTDEEYDKYVHLDGRWTREETDLLMQLCNRFGLRFIVIHDRYSTMKDSNSPERTVEDLKDRFYTIQRSLLQARNPDKNLSSHPMFAQAYNKSQEKDRKAQLEKLFTRTHEEEEEMAKLLTDYRKITATLKKKRTEKKVKKQKEKERSEAMKNQESSGQRSGASRIGENIPTTNTDQIERIRQSLPPKAIPRNPFANLPDGVYLRHEEPIRQMQTSDHMQNFVSEELRRLGFDKDTPLTVPTKGSCQIYDQLRLDIATVYNLEMLVKQKDAQTQALQERFKLQKQSIQNRMQRQNTM